MKILLFLTICMLIVSCSTSGVLPHTNGTYTVSASHFISAKAKQAAYEDAIKFCKGKNKEMEIISAPTRATENYSIIFICKK